MTEIDYDALPDEVREAAVQEVQNSQWYMDYDWHDCVYEDFIRIAGLMGVDVREEDIQFRGFWSQGDGANFTGDWSMPPHPIMKTIRAEAPLDEELIRIAYELWDAQRRNFYKLYAKIYLGYGRGSHSGNMCVDLTNTDTGNEVPQTYDDQVRNAMRWLADWLYDQLNSAYDHLTSDEVVWESIKDNGWELKAITQYLDEQKEAA